MFFGVPTTGTYTSAPYSSHFVQHTTTYTTPTHSIEYTVYTTRHHQGRGSSSFTKVVLRTICAVKGGMGGAVEYLKREEERKGGETSVLKQFSLVIREEERRNIRFNRFELLAALKSGHRERRAPYFTH